MFYRIIHSLPKIPEELEDDLFKLSKDDDAFLKDSINTGKFYNRSGKDGQIQTFPKINLTNTRVEDWLKTNIHANAKFYQLIKNIHLGESFWPHVDRTRKFSLNYLIQTGGDPYTVFYKTKDDSQPYPAQTWPNYENLIEVDRVKIPIKTWTLLSVNKPHSIEGLSGNRISVHLSFDENVFD